MTNEERCFKMTKLERYKLDKENVVKSAATSTAVTCLLAMGVVAGFIGENDKNLLISLFSSGVLPIALNCMIHSICDKTNLESKISDLELDLELGETYSGGRKL